MGMVVLLNRDPGSYRVDDQYAIQGEKEGKFRDGLALPLNLGRRELGAGTFVGGLNSLTRNFVVG